LLGCSSLNVYCHKLPLNHAQQTPILFSVPQCPNTPGGMVMSILTFIEAIIFGLFVIIMLFDQIQAIFENTPGIDALQNRTGESVCMYACVCVCVWLFCFGF